MIYPKRAPALLVIAAALLGVLLAPSGAPAQDSGGKINGMTVSTPRGSAEWGRDNMVPTITDLRSLGVNWIAIHPYAGIERDGTVRWRRGEGPDEAPEWLTRPIREAHAQGVKIFVKPHLAYWGRFSWRGEIEFASEEEWQRFFSTYRQWIEAMARFSAGADAFAVGTELDRTVHRPEWRDVIEDVRRSYTGPLTYAANWTDFERVPFWDALDAIGIQAYFPLLEQGSMAEGQLPTRTELEAGWETIMARMRDFGARHGRTVVFTELGYNNSWLAATEPWDAATSPDPAAAELQRLCMEVALEAIAREQAVVGAFLWKWFPGDRIPRDFAMSSPAMREVIGSRWSMPDAR